MIMRHGEGRYLKLALGFCLFFLAILVFLGIDYITRQVRMSRYDSVRPWVIAEPASNYLIIVPQEKKVNIVTTQEGTVWPSDMKVENQVTVSISYPEKIALSLYQSSMPAVSVFDALRLWFFLKSGVKVTTYYLPEDPTLQQSSPFWDNGFSKENKTIQIVNASGVTGEGNHLASMLGEYGVRVISVETGHEIQHNTQIVGTSDSYTLKRLGLLFHTNTSIDTKKQTVADIVIIIGENKW